MAGQSGLIFSKIHDRRSRGTEEAIFAVFAHDGTSLSTKIFIKRAGISSSTFYRHHKSIGGLLYDYEHLIMEQFLKFVSELRDKSVVDVKQVIYRMLVFIMVNKDIIEVVADRDNYHIIYSMVKTLRGKVVLAGCVVRDANRIFDIYACEVCGVIKNWHEGGYSERVLPKVESDIVYLTLTINDRLGKLAD